TCAVSRLTGHGITTLFGHNCSGEASLTTAREAGDSLRCAGANPVKRKNSTQLVFARSFDWMGGGRQAAAGGHRLPAGREVTMATVQVRYIVHDVDAAIAFYTQHLGF